MLTVQLILILIFNNAYHTKILSESRFKTENLVVG